MARRAGCDVVYDAAQHWVEAALRKDDSLFTPGHPIWSLDNLNDFHQCFVEATNPPGSGFFEKLHSLLLGAPRDTIQLAAEILYVHYLIAAPPAISGRNKRERISQVLGWTNSAVPIPNDLDSVLDSGILFPGPAFGASKPAHIEFIAEFLLYWKRHPDERQSIALGDPWRFRDEVKAVVVPKAGLQTESILHLTFPDTFEPTVSRNQKMSLRNSFGTLLEAPTGDVDRDLLDIRHRLSGHAEHYKDGFDFYSDGIRFTWSPDVSAWDRFIGWGSRFIKLQHFDKWERNYKLDIATSLEHARLAIERGSDDWLTLLNQAFRHKDNNLVYYITQSRFSIWCSENNTEAREALFALWGDRSNWSSKENASVAIGDFLRRVPEDSPSGKGTRITLASFLAMAVDPRRFPPYGTTTFERGYDLTGYPYPDKSASDSVVYEHVLSFLDRILAEAEKRKIALRDRLDAQSMLWSVINWTTEDHPDFPEFEHDALRRFREADAPPTPAPPTFAEPIENQAFAQNRIIPTLHLPEASGGSGALTYALKPEPPAGLACDEDSRELSGAPTVALPSATFTWSATDEDRRSVEQTFSITVEPETLDDVATRLFWDADHLRDIQRLIEHKQQVVFYGPPGTGKTYVAIELARHFAGEGGLVDLVQFHPSYAYEDFVEGFRPADQNGQPGFQLREGPLKRIAERARDNPGATHVLVIDEINRGNVARVFGELYFLLEYRGPDHEISLQYSDRKFSLPDNLWFIATMNTADRSIALVDAALRRRFHFFPFFPDKPPVDGLLAEWLEREKPTMKWVADLLKSANDKLSDRHLAIGPSHFIRKDLDEEWVERIWDYSILPYIEEQLFGQEERLAEFDYAKLRAEVQSADVVANGDGDAASPAS
ncbi:MAG: AAA family ATPase [Chloroflexota bacterium]|nr:AAA family ATPase [Chloroflexota bacterium]MDE2919837.1 AAA family ATPase [Chloroflexota bacterium]